MTYIRILWPQLSYSIHCRLFWSPVGFDYPHYKDEGCFIRAPLKSSSVPLPWIWLLWEGEGLHQDMS